MVQLTRINHCSLVINSDLIEHIETTPDTVITMTTGQKFLVLESAEDVVQKVVAFRRSIAMPDVADAACHDCPCDGECQHAA
jgi:flagellar protein FlbD